jgi:hypothetical protein
MAARDQRLNDLDHQGDLFGGTGVLVRRLQSQRVERRLVDSDVAVAELIPALAKLVGPPQDVVVNVGDVLDVADLVAEVA